MYDGVIQKKGAVPMTYQRTVAHEHEGIFEGCCGDGFCNSLAHGYVRIEQICAWGAQWVINLNQGHVENSAWIENPQ